MKKSGQDWGESHSLAKILEAIRVFSPIMTTTSRWLLAGHSPLYVSIYRWLFSFSFGEKTHLAAAQDDFVGTVTPAGATLGLPTLGATIEMTGFERMGTWHESSNLSTDCFIVFLCVSAHWASRPSPASDPGLPSWSFTSHGSSLCFHKSWRKLHVNYGAAFGSFTHCRHRGK